MDQVFDFDNASKLGESRRVGKGRRPSTLRKHEGCLRHGVDGQAPCYFICSCRGTGGRSIPLSLLS